MPADRRPKSMSNDGTPLSFGRRATAANPRSALLRSQVRARRSQLPRKHSWLRTPPGFLPRSRSSI